jgi:hypothetical protein
MSGDNRYEEGVVAAHSTPSLKRNQLTRSAKKLSMEFDERYRSMSKADRDAFLDQLFPEEREVFRDDGKKFAQESEIGLTSS